MVPQDPLVLLRHRSSTARESAGIGTQKHVNTVVDDQTLRQGATAFAPARVVIANQTHKSTRRAIVNAKPPRSVGVVDPSLYPCPGLTPRSTVAAGERGSHAERDG